MSLVQKMIFLLFVLLNHSAMAQLRYCANDEIRKKIFSSVSMTEEAYESFSEMEKVMLLKSCYFGFKLFKDFQNINKFEKLHQLSELKEIRLKKLKELNNEKIVSIACENRLKHMNNSDQSVDINFLGRVCESAYRYSLSN